MVLRSLVGFVKIPLHLQPSRKFVTGLATVQSLELKGQFPNSAAPPAKLFSHGRQLQQMLHLRHGASGAAVALNSYLLALHQLFVRLDGKLLRRASLSSIG